MRGKKTPSVKKIGIGYYVLSVFIILGMLNSLYGILLNAMKFFNSANWHGVSTNAIMFILLFFSMIFYTICLIKKDINIIPNLITFLCLANAFRVYIHILRIFSISDYPTVVISVINIIKIVISVLIAVYYVHRMDNLTEKLYYRLNVLNGPCMVVFFIILFILRSVSVTDVYWGETSLVPSYFIAFLLISLLLTCAILGAISNDFDVL